MEYNTSGIRTKRVSEEKTYNYIYAGDKLMRMTVGNDTLDFSYDTNGVPLTMSYNGTVYYYITNLQGDVMKLERADGGGGAQYAYDAWGNIIAMSGTLAELNPLRYRGYVYDQETGFYYLNSRYYDPAVGRFISADNYPTTGQGLNGNNMFAYCGNNPVSRQDDGGEFWNIVIGAGVGAVVSGLISVASQVLENKGIANVDWARVGVAAAAGAISGGFAATGIKVNGQMVVNGIIGAASSGIDTYLKSNGTASFSEYAKILLLELELALWVAVLEVMEPEQDILPKVRARHSRGRVMPSLIYQDLDCEVLLKKFLRLEDTTTVRLPPKQYEAGEMPSYPLLPVISRMRLIIYGEQSGRNDRKCVLTWEIT